MSEDLVEKICPMWEVTNTKAKKYGLSYVINSPNKTCLGCGGHDEFCVDNPYNDIPKSGANLELARE
jgi:hypothetical protein